MKKALVIIGIVLAALILCSTAACAVLGVLALQKIGGLQALTSEMQALVGDMQARIDEMNAKTEDVAQENDVTIAGQYVIRSTEKISDAYRSGDRSELSDRDKETLDMASAVLGEIITDGMTPYDKEVAVYDWMTSSLKNDNGLLIVIPQTQEDCDNPYGVLKYHNAVCVGYATTFRLFMQMLDIPCMVVHNSELYHSWDLVQLNGHWYHTDIYSDVGSGGYTHFNRTDYMQGIDQNWNRTFFPDADSYEFCYIVKNAEQEKDIYRIPARVRKALDDKESRVTLKFDKSFDEGQAQICEAMLSDIESTMYNSYEYSNISLERNWLTVDDGFVLAISLNRYNEDPDPIEFTDEIYEKIADAVNGSFGDIQGKSDDYTSGKWDDWDDWHDDEGNTVDGEIAYG